MFRHAVLDLVVRMTEDNVYVRSGTRSKMSADMFDGEDLPDDWDFEQETWNVAVSHSTGCFVQDEGVRAALEALGEFQVCQTCRVSYILPKTPIDDAEKVLNVFPGVLSYANRTVWILGMEDLVFVRDTGFREETLFLKSSDDKPHFTDLPGNLVRLSRRYFILRDVPVPDWIKESAEWITPETL